MAAADVTVYEAAAKEGWTQDDLEVQFHKEDPLLDEIEKRSSDGLLGEYALTGIHTGRAGGVTMVPSTGSKELNAPDSQKINQAKWKYGRINDAVEIDTAAVKQIAKGSKAVASSVDTEIEGTLSDMRKQVTRQLFLDQTGLICQVAKHEEAVKTLKLAITGEYGLGAVATRQGWLVEGQEIDIGTTENETALAADRVITAVDDTETAPTITISGEAVKGLETHYVSLKNARSGKTSYEFNGLRLINSTTAKLGEVSPESEPGWKPAFVDTTGGVLTRQRVIAGRRKVRTRGKRPDWAITSLEQVENLENETYPQVRFDSPDKQNTGDGEHVMIGNLKVQGHEDSPPGDFTYLRKEHLFCLRDEKPYWLTEQYGGGKIFALRQGTTFLYGDLEYMFQLAVNRRNVFGQYRGLK